MAQPICPNTSNSITQNQGIVKVQLQTFGQSGRMIMYSGISMLLSTAIHNKQHTIKPSQNIFIKIISLYQWPASTQIPASI